MSDPIVKCDHCKQPGRRRPGHPCPDHWLYLESNDALNGSLYIIWACSDVCRDALWKRGPGEAVLAEDRAALYRQRKPRTVALTEAEVEDLGSARNAVAREIEDSLNDGGATWAAGYVADLRRRLEVLDMLLATLAPKNATSRRTA